MYLNDTLIPEGNIREEFQDGKSKKSNPFRHALCDRPDPAVLHRPDPGSGKCSCHERLEAYYDLKVFLTIDPIEQIQRIEKRNGSERRWNFRRNGFRSRSCILKNAAPEAGATSVLQCVMRCRKIRYRIFFEGSSKISVPDFSNSAYESARPSPAQSSEAFRHQDSRGAYQPQKSDDCHTSYNSKFPASHCSRKYRA